MIKINDSKEYNKILTGKGVEQLQHTPLTLQENMLLCKSADSLMSSARLIEKTDADATLSLTITVPKGETWRILAVEVVNSAQDITGLTVRLNLRNYDTGVVGGMTWHYQATLSAAVPFTGTSMGSSGVVLNEGDSVYFAGTVAGASTTYCRVIIMLAHAGFATQ